MSSYPTYFKDPSWAQLFRELPVDQVDAACTHWFKQWPRDASKPYYIEEFDCDVLDNMLTFHELSNRVDADMEKSLVLMETLHDFGGNNSLIINAFHSALALIGWRGIAMRCWTDVQGYAGMIQYINNSNGVLTFIDDLALNMSYSLPLFQALDSYPQLFDYPWVQAAFVRAAIDGAQTHNGAQLTKYSSFYTWLVQSYGVTSQNKADRFEQDDVGCIAEHPQVNTLLESPGFWLHLLYQECHGMGGVNLYGSTGRLWGSWMKMAGREHPAVPLIAEMSYYRQDTALILCGLAQRPIEEAEVMQLWRSPRECLLYLLSNPTSESLELPSEMSTPY